MVVVFLHAIPILTNEHSIEAALPSYFLHGEASQLAARGVLRPEVGAPLLRYHYWPGFLFLSTVIQQVTGVRSFAIPKFFPLVNQTLFALLAYVILKDLLPPQFALIAAMWAIASNFYFLMYFGPQGQAILLSALLLFFFVRMANRKHLDFPSALVMAVIFIAIIVTHYFTPFSLVLAGFFAMTASRSWSGANNRNMGFPAFVVMAVVAFVAYHVYVLGPFFEPGLRHLVDAMLGRTPENPSSLLLNLSAGASRYFYWTLISDSVIMAINALVALVAILRAVILRKAQGIAIWVAWLFGLALTGLFAQDADGPIRSFILGVVPLSYLCVMFLSARPRFLAAVLAMLIVLHIPAHYGNVIRVDRRVTTSELVGRAAYLGFVRPRSTVFYQSAYQSWSGDPARSSEAVLLLRMPPTNSRRGLDIRGWPGERGEDVVWRLADYVIDSEMQREESKYVLGVDFLERLNLATWGSQWYDNGQFRVFIRDQ
jgi:hypothetical protein